MREITISVEEYKALLEASIKIDMLMKRVRKEQYVGRSDLVEILGMEGSDE